MSQQVWRVPHLEIRDEPTSGVRVLPGLLRVKLRGRCAPNPVVQLFIDNGWVRRGKYRQIAN